jgi:RNA polymerase sigma-70 factor, ECF subfamily
MLAPVRSTQEPFSAAASLSAIALHRDPGALEQLFHFYGPRLKSWLQGQRVDEATAEDIIQETMVTLWRKAGLYDPLKASPSTWIYTIARHVRLQKRHRAMMTAQVPLLPFLDEPGTEGPEENLFIKESLNTLTPEQFQIVYDTFFLGMTQPEMAESHDVPVGTVKSRLRLALKKLRDLAGWTFPWLSTNLPGV